MYEDDHTNVNSIFENSAFPVIWKHSGLLSGMNFASFSYLIFIVSASKVTGYEGLGLHSETALRKIAASGTRTV